MSAATPAAYNAPVGSPERTALVFDMDNTLVGSRIDFAAIRRSLVALLARAGAASFPPTGLLARPIADLVSQGESFDRAHGTSLVPEMWRIIAAYELDGLRGATALDDAPAVLAALRRDGFRIAVVTNNAREAARRALQSTGLWPSVEVLVSRDDVAALKPAGDGVVEALRRLAPVERAFVIGDSWIDGAAAHVAGALFIAYRRAAEDLVAHGVRPWRVISHLGDLRELVTKSA